MKFKELDEKKKYLWIMLINSIVRAKLTFFCMISLFWNNVFQFFDITGAAWLSSVLVAKYLIKFKKERNFFLYLLNKI